MGDWNPSTVWWLVAGVLVALELVTGTFYLLMLALGAAVGALAAHASMGIQNQMLMAALAGSAAVAWWHLLRRRRPGVAALGVNRDLNLDIGATVQVAEWQADGSARVRHRGADWDALYRGGGSPQPGEHVIRGTEGNRLLLAAEGH